ncbi:TRAP transporter small permease subunit [Chloroflexota bacterium]
MIRHVGRAIEAVSEIVGKVASWGCVVLVFALTYEVVARHVFRNPTVWAHITATMSLVLIASWGLAYTHKHDAHIRVDVLYAHLSARGRAIVNVVGAVFGLIPFLVITIQAAYAKVVFALGTDEVLLESYWYPPAAPIRIVMLVGLCLFLLQAIVVLCRDAYRLARSNHV